MALVRLIYSSKRTKGIEMPDLLRLLDKSTESNERIGITGLLCFTKDEFLQVLEGNPLSVNRLYRKIIVDGRNSEVTLIHYTHVSTREFSDWAMGFVDLADISIKDLAMSIIPNITMNELDPNGALSLLKEISKTLHR